MIGDTYIGIEEHNRVVAERDRLRADLQRLQSSPAPVAGGVPEITPEDIDAGWNAYADKNPDIKYGEDDADWLVEIYATGMRDAETLLASRLPALKTGEVVVREDEWRELRAFARISGYPEGRFTFEVPFGRQMDDWGTDIARRMGITRDEEQAWLDSLPAQATTSGEAGG